MKLRRGHWRFALLGVVFVAACGSVTSGTGTGGTGGGGGVSGTAGGSGRGGAAATAGASGTGGSAAGTAGAPGTGGNASGTGGTAGTTGVSGTGGGAGTSGATGAGGTSGRGGGAGTGAAGTGGGAGAAGRGGSSAGAGGTGGTGGTAGRGGTGGTGGLAGATAGTGGVAGGAGAGVAGTTGTGGGGGTCVTSVSGTVYDPAGVLPLYNVSVYAPTTALTAITEGVSCDRCGLLSGTPAAVTVSDAQGKFKLAGIPAGANIQIVFQIGKWRRQVTLPNVAACADTPITDVNLTRLPRSKAEGNIPRIAVSTGGSDALECFVRRIGIDNTEFTSDTGQGRVHLYAGGNGTNSFMTGGAFSAATTLWSNPTKLAAYDMIGFSCEGSTSQFAAQKPQTSVDNVAAYASSGGRLFFSHLHVTWLQRAADFSGTAAYVGNLDPPASPVTLTVNQTFAKGQALASWLAGPAVNASTTLGQLVSVGSEHSVTSVTPPTTEWIYLPSNTQDTQGRRSVQFLSFETANQCGKVMFTDMHVKVGVDGAGSDDSDPSLPFPSGCKTNASTAQMKAFEFLFFDLGACL